MERPAARLWALIWATAALACAGLALAFVLRRLTSEDSLREDLVNRGKARARLFSWEKAVRETWEVYRKIA